MAREFTNLPALDLLPGLGFTRSHTSVTHTLQVLKSDSDLLTEHASSTFSLTGHGEGAR